ncbi:MAG: hypothetical protein ACKOF9_09935 [Burkholderiales bacterium]
MEIVAQGEKQAPHALMTLPRRTMRLFLSFQYLLKISFMMQPEI